MSLRVFLPPSRTEEAQAEITLDGDESHYLAKVRRARVGDSVEVLGGAAGRAWSARVVALERRAARVQLLAPLPPPQPPPPPRLVLLGMPDAPAVLDSLSAASEAGATRLALIRCARSQGRGPSPARVERVLRAAQRQCGRRLPLVVEGLEQPWTLARALEHHAEWPGHVAWARECGRSSAADLDAPAPGRRLLVGPEGGLTDGEVTLAMDAGFQMLSLGPWVLRTPTAVVAGLARLLPRTT